MEFYIFNQKFPLWQQPPPDGAVPPHGTELSKVVEFDKYLGIETFFYANNGFIYAKDQKVPNGS